MSKKFRVYVTGQLDWDYEVEAVDEQDAEDIAEVMFQRDFDQVLWSAVNAVEIEEHMNES